MKKVVLCVVLLFTLSLVPLAFGQENLSVPVKQYIQKQEVDKAKAQQDKTKKIVIESKQVNGETVSNNQLIQKSIPADSQSIKTSNTK